MPIKKEHDHYITGEKGKGINMTEKENYMKMIHGEQPEWIPYYRDAVDWVLPGYVCAHMATEEKRDLYGVKWTVNDAGPIADVSFHVMQDINDWKKYVRIPDLDSLDWETMAEQDLKNADRENKVTIVMPQLSTSGCFFIPLMDMMGFENGLCALWEEPDVVSEFFDYICTNMEKAIDYEMKYYKPDMMLLADDFCAAYGPMIAYPLYEEVLRPYYKRLISRILSYGVPVEFHICGKGEEFIDDFVSMGISAWQPAQPMNDLKGMKQKYGNKLVLNGTWYSSSPAGAQGAPEDLVRQSVRDCMDNFGPGGGFCFWDGDPVGTSEDMLQKMAWLADEARSYGRQFYKKMGSER